MKFYFYSKTICYSLNRENVLYKPLNTLVSEPTVPLKVCSSFALTCSVWACSVGVCRKYRWARADTHLNDGIKSVRCLHRMGHINNIHATNTSSPPPPAPPPPPCVSNGNKCISLKTHHSTQMLFVESLITVALSACAIVCVCVKFNLSKFSLLHFQNDVLRQAQARSFPDRPMHILNF